MDRKRFIGGTYTIYIWPIFQGISPQNMVLWGTNVPPFYDSEIPIDMGVPQ